METGVTNTMEHTRYKMDRELFEKAVDNLYSVTTHFGLEVIVDAILDGGNELAYMKRVRNNMRVKRSELMTEWDDATDPQREQLVRTLSFDPSVLT